MLYQFKFLVLGGLFGFILLAVAQAHEPEAEGSKTGLYNFAHAVCTVGLDEAMFKLPGDSVQKTLGEFSKASEDKALVGLIEQLTALLVEKEYTSGKPLPEGGQEIIAQVCVHVEKTHADKPEA